MAQTATTSATDIIEGWRADGIRFVRFELPDMHGTSRSKIVPIEQAPGYCEEGLNMYGGAAVLDSRSDVVPGTLYHEEIGYGDQRLFPDPATGAPVPWLDATARFICDSRFADGEPLRALPRYVFRRQLDRAHDLGYEPVMGFEPEFYLLNPDGTPLFSGYQIFNSVRNTYIPLISEIVDQLNAFGIQIITANCEYAGSQWEINFRPGSGMAGPDNAFTFKNAVKQLAHMHGLNATFMSKPFADSAGSGCHTHVSLTDLGSGENVFGDDGDPQGMTATCRQFMAGQLRHARAVYALLAPTVNCLKRRRPHTFSPSNISWGLEDRSALLRIKGGSAGTRHVENRAPTGLCNPYLVGAALLAAGLNGVEEELELEPAAATPAEQDPSKAPLPTTVHESLQALESDEKLVDALGRDFVTAYTTMRRYELQRFDDHVTDWERQEYIEVF
ncbi:MAG TPA: glutamine synthetase family protein [Gaiellales bacterium]|nr:glutamine synthetase family protein [Gaiellales bacterium]